MSREIRSASGALAAVVACAVLSAGAWAGAAEMQTRSWANSNRGFEEFARRIEDDHPRNLLARKGVRVQTRQSGAEELIDGDAGERAGAGRVNVGGQPTLITYYLGGPKPIHRVGMFTFNGDMRANQDYEVYLADNSSSPGKMPEFAAEPTFTTGSKVLGADRGGFYAGFAAAGDKPVIPQKADWVQFRIWRTYPVRAGSPAKNRNATGWSAVIELQVFGDPKDVKLVPPEVRQRRQALRAAIRKLLRQPPYEKKATWQETMLAAREAMLRWECQLDALAAGEVGVEIGPWRTTGPLPAGDEALRHIERLKKVDLSQPVTFKAKDGKVRSLRWRACPQAADGETADLAAALGAKAGETIVLCRSLSMQRGFRKGGSFAFGVGLAAGQLRLVGGRSSVRGPGHGHVVTPNQISWALRDGPGAYHVLAVLPVSKAGACRFWFTPQPPAGKYGAGDTRRRISRRQALYERIKRDFADPVSRRQIGWEQWDSIWVRFVRRQMAGRTYFLSDWQPGRPAFLVDQYNQHADLRAAKVEEELATAEGSVRAKVAPWLAALRKAGAPRTLAAARKRYYAVATVQEAMATHHRVESMRLAVEDQKRTFPRRYPKGEEYLRRVAALAKEMARAWPAVCANRGDALAAVAAVGEKAAAEGREILLDNPLLKFDKLLLGRGGPGFGSNWGGPNYVGSEIVALSPVRPDGKFTTIHKGRVTDMDLSFDAKKVLFCDGRHVQEINVDGTGHRQITKQTDPHVHHYDACRLPNGQIVFVSTACEQAVPCTGQWHVGNLHVMDDDGTGERRLTFDQDHNWNPCMLANGQVVYTRWEYTDTPHYFSRLLFSMNPDGTAQMEYYGSNSYWPNAMYWPRPIPGHPTRVVCIVSGHHGVSRVGQMVILDNARGRQEADGVVHRIGDRGKRVEPVIMDGLVKEWWPRFAFPYPLGEPGTHRGAGKYFLANCRMTQWSPWSICLVDVFDNITPLLESGYACPIPLRRRPKPPVIPSRVDLARRDGLVYMANVYAGGGLRGFPVGSVKALRIGSHVYRYGGNGDTRAASFEGGWDVKRILGTVPVEPDGSAYFRVPANIPVFIQPLDAEGKALQTMRSWFTAMPGEVLSCVGCHERQSTTPGTYAGLAPSREPSEIQPWFGPTRGFSFDREVQPVLDARCAGCHNGQARPDGERIPDFRAKRLHKEYTGNYSPAYLALAPYVRRAGYEADYHLAAPAEWCANTSPLVHMLRKGHHNVHLTAQQWRRLFAWIDFNVPYAANWRDSHRPPEEDQVTRRIKYMKLYAGIDLREESPHPLPPIGTFQAPKPAPRRPAPVRLAGWPLTTAQAAEAQRKTALGELVLDLGGGETMRFVPIPAGQFVMGDANGFPDETPQSRVQVSRAFYLGRLEVTNRQYARFDPTHDSAYMDARFKDRFTRGYPVNEPNQPVIRVSWHEAMGFCRWLTAKTGRLCTLPTEAEWEYACRAGSAGPWHVRASSGKPAPFANVADASLSGWAWGRVESGYHDAARFSAPGGRYPPNAWGLCDMHGNVAEWTLSEYRPYPYAAGDGRNAAPAASGAGLDRRAVRGGSWNDKLRDCRSAWRWGYPPHQPVYNVGFRVLCRPDKLVKR